MQKQGDNTKRRDPVRRVRLSFRKPAAAVSALLLAVLVCAGCRGAGSTEEPVPRSRFRVVTTIFPQYDFARQIAGGSADVTMLLKPGEEVHSYEPTPRDIKMIQNCDLFIYTGGENDVWVESILDSMGDGGPRAVRLLDLVDTFEEEMLEGMMPERGGHEEEHAHPHEEEEEPDEHVWTSPANCVILLDRLTEEFCAMDPAHEEVYRENGLAYRDQFVRLDEEYRETAAAAERKTILFGDRFPFRYLAEELDLTCYAAFSGCSSESEPSAATIAFLIDKAAEEKLPVVFKIEFSNGNIAAAICEAAGLRMEKDRAQAGGADPKTGGGEEQRAGAGKDRVQTTGADPETGETRAAAAGPETVHMQVLQLHSCHNVTRDEFAAGETCLSLMTKNLEALRTALGQKR